MVKKKKANLENVYYITYQKFTFSMKLMFSMFCTSLNIMFIQILTVWPPGILFEAYAKKKVLALIIVNSTYVLYKQLTFGARLFESRLT